MGKVESLERSFKRVMNSPDPDTNDLLSRASHGDSRAALELFEMHRNRLKRMIATRMDERLSARFDPSDVVQETFIVASRRMHTYKAEKPVAFYPWLRQIAWERLIDLQREHMKRERRSVKREVRDYPPLPDQSAAELANRLVSSGTTPIQGLMRKEARKRMQAALKNLPNHYREVLVLRHLEQLSVNETAEVLQITPSGVKSRYYRAVQLMHAALRDGSEDRGS